MTNQNSTLSFRVSAGLKNIIGRDLISDKYIAIFELVKNSYECFLLGKHTVERVCSGLSPLRRDRLWC